MNVCRTALCLIHRFPHLIIGIYRWGEMERPKIIGRMNLVRLSHFARSHLRCGTAMRYFAIAAMQHCIADFPALPRQRARSFSVPRVSTDSIQFTFRCTRIGKLGESAEPALSPLLPPSLSRTVGSSVLPRLCRSGLEAGPRTVARFLVLSTSRESAGREVGGTKHTALQ